MITGVSFPLEIIKGQLSIVSDADLTYRHIIAFLQTETSERLGLIEFGLPDYLFLSYPDFLRIGNNIKERLEQNIENCSFDVISELGEDGAGKVQINWTYLLEDQDPIILQLR